MSETTYTHGHHESVLRSHRWRTAANSAAYLLDELTPGRRLLDVGCGPGTLTVDLARLVAPGRVVGIDASAEVVRAAATDAAAESVGAAVDVEFVVGDAYATGLSDGSFDIVHAHQVLQHLTDPVAALREWRRVAASGAVVAARDADYAAMTWYPHEPLLDRWLELYRAAAYANRAEPDAGRRLLAWAHAAGFDDVTASASAWCYATPDERTWWAQLWADRFTSSAVAGQLVASGLSDADELASIGTAWLRWAADPDAWFMVPHGEIRCRA